MPSTTVDTLGSAAMEKLIVPTPRITMALLALVVPLRKLTDGAITARSSMLSTPLACSCSPVKAEIAMGTSWTSCSTFCAVTTMVSMPAGVSITSSSASCGYSTAWA